MGIFLVTVNKQIVNLHYMLSKSVTKSRPTVLWCYKDKLELSRLVLATVTFSLEIHKLETGLPLIIWGETILIMDFDESCILFWYSVGKGVAFLYKDITAVIINFAN